jgi:adenine/guanine phosphoribosyltransferase-like PRPP-binding protein
LRQASTLISIHFATLTDVSGDAGGSAKAAGELVAKQGGKTVEYIFVVGLPFLKGHEKLDAPAYSIIQAED